MKMKDVKLNQKIKITVSDAEIIAKIVKIRGEHDLIIQAVKDDYGHDWHSVGGEMGNDNKEYYYIYDNIGSYIENLKSWQLLEKKKLLVRDLL